MSSLVSLDKNTSECSICYEQTINDNIPLTCCDESKIVCVECISCLKTYVCPYCRQNLPDDICLMIYKKNKSLIQAYSNSVPGETTNWDYFIENEYLIDPYSFSHELNSKILRKKMREIRKRFLARNRVHNHSTSSYVDYRDYRRRRRHNMKALTQNISARVQSVNDIDNVEDELIFELED